jgi:hypothetical protein
MKKTWKKTHRQRKFKRTKLWKVELEEAALSLVISYSRKHGISRKRCVEKALKAYVKNN